MVEGREKAGAVLARARMGRQLRRAVGLRRGGGASGGASVQPGSAQGQLEQTALQGKAERGSWLLWTASTGFEVTEDTVQGARDFCGQGASSNRRGSGPEPNWASGY